MDASQGSAIQPGTANTIEWDDDRCQHPGDRESHLHNSSGRLASPASFDCLTVTNPRGREVSTTSINIPCQGMEQMLLLSRCTLGTVPTARFVRGDVVSAGIILLWRSTIR